MMKRLFFSITATLLLMTACAQTNNKSAKAGKATLQTELDSVSYAIGLSVASSLKNQGIEMNADVVAKAIQNVNSGGDHPFSPEEGDMMVRNYMQGQMAVQQEANIKKGEDFLAENAKK